MECIETLYDFRRSSFMYRISRFVVVCALVSGILSTVAIESASAANAPPVITSTSTAATQLTISGANFLPGTASVLLGTFGPLAVVTQTDSQLVVTLPPGITAG